MLLPGRQVQAAQVPFRFNDTLSHTRARAATHTREHLSPSSRPFRVSVGRGTSNSPKEKEGKREKNEKRLAEVTQRTRR